MVIFDTSAIIDFSKGNKNLARALRETTSEDNTFKISLVTIFELSCGEPPGISSERQKLLESFDVVELTAKTMVNAGAIHRKLIRQGLEIQAFDSIIAATAISINEPIVTANERHFNRISGLQVIGYRT